MNNILLLGQIQGDYSLKDETQATVTRKAGWELVGEDPSQKCLSEKLCLQLTTLMLSLFPQLQTIVQCKCPFAIQCCTSGGPVNRYNFLERHLAICITRLKHVHDI